MNRVCRALIIEDEAMVAMLIEDLLTDLGCEVGHSAANAREAERAAQDCDVDFALLDVNLGDGQTSFGAAQLLKARRVPYAWVTGYGAQVIPAEHGDAPVLHKPVNPGLLASVVRRFSDERGCCTDEV